MLEINKLPIIQRLKNSSLDHVAQSLSEWQQQPGFNDFLKENPMSEQENLEFLQEKLDGKNSLLLGAINRTSNKIMGIFMLHSFDDKNGSVEASSRVDPIFKGKGVGTMLTSAGLNVVFMNKLVSKVTCWHSALNKGTFFKNLHLGGNLVDFVPNQTFLPNIGRMTDDFKWEFVKKHCSFESIPSDVSSQILEILSQSKKEQILEGLQKHILVD